MALLNILCKMEPSQHFYCVVYVHNSQGAGELWAFPHFCDTKSLAILSIYRSRYYGTLVCIYVCVSVCVQST